MPKTQRNYERIFYKIQEISNIKPMLVVVNFEKGLANEVELAFETNYLIGFFSFRLNHLMKDTTKGVYVNYLQNNTFKLDVQKIILLVFFFIKSTQALQK